MSLMLRVIAAAFLSSLLAAPAMAVDPTPATAPDVSAEVMSQATGAPALVNLGNQATLRLRDGVYFLPERPAEKLLLASGQQPPPDMVGLLLGPDGLDMAGPIRFVPAGFVNDAALPGWTPDDILASLRDTVERANPDRVRQNHEPLEARTWVQPPRYDPASHQLAWASLVIPKSAPRGSGGQVIYNAIALGRNGFLQLSVPSNLEKAAEVEHLTAAFLAGVSFHAGNGFSDVAPNDPRAENGLAQAMGLDSLHKAPVETSFWHSDAAVPVLGGVTLGLAAIALFIYRSRRARQEARRG